MRDILLDSDGDIYINDSADLALRHSVRQDVKIHLKWFFSEWRFAPDFGVPYFEDVFIKNPNIDRIKQIVRDEAGKADDVKEVKNITINIDNITRNAVIGFSIVTDYGVFREELTINV